MVSPEGSRTRNYDLEDDLLENHLRVVGYKVIRLKQSVWKSTLLGFFQPFPYHGPMELSESEIKELWDKGSFLTRYPVHIDSIGSRPTWVHLLDDKNYELDKLTSRKRRRDIRRSLKLCSVEQIPLKDILKTGLDLIPDTMSRQGLHWEPWITQKWKRFFESASENPLFEAWAAFEGNRLGAYRVDMTYRRGCFPQVIFNRSDSLRFKVMDALTYVSSREIMRRPEINFISLGIVNGGDMPSPLDKFKESMGYSMLRNRERVEVCPKLKPFFRSNRFCGLVEQLNNKCLNKSFSGRAMCWVIDRLVGPLSSRRFSSSDVVWAMGCIIDTLQEQARKTSMKTV